VEWPAEWTTIEARANQAEAAFAPPEPEEAGMAALTGHLRRNLVAYLALFVALGSTSYAAGTKLLPRNSVGTHQVINGSLQRVDLSARAVKALRGRRGPAGRVGPQGPRGPQGPAADLTMVTGSIGSLCGVHSGDCHFGASTAICPPGHLAVSGGWHEVVGPSDVDVSVTSNTHYHALGGVDGWSVGMRNNSDTPWSFQAIAMCT
jgi:hypothetical protein